MYRDPKVRSEGRVPWRKALSGPWFVVELKGNKALLRSSEAGPEKPCDVWAHLEDCIVCPPDATEIEAVPIEFEADDGDVKSV